MLRRVFAWAFIATIVGMPAVGETQTDDENDFEISLDARARIEWVEQNNALDDATATTLMLRAGIETPTWQGLSALLELETVHALGSEDYNSGGNGRTQYSVIPDPEDTEVNQFLVSYLNGVHSVRAGRQRMVLDNARFFGDVVFRQNQQTFDALTYTNTALQGQQLRYVYMTRARRFLSDENPVGEIDMNTHLLNYRWQRLNGDVFSTYAYLLDMDTAAVKQNSTKTFGLRYTGSRPMNTVDVLYVLEYANQSDYAGGASTNDADYLSAEFGLKFKNEWVAKIGHERLGGDGVFGFQTPFGTNHIFNGLADVFAADTPATGLIDSYAKLTIPIWGARTLVAIHDFSADQGSADYGTEIDLQIGKRFSEHFGVNLLYANYQADNFGSDTIKWLLWFDVSY